MEESLCEAAIMGSIDSLAQIIAKDPLILDKIVVGCFQHGKSPSPLHMAVTSRQTQFVEHLLYLKPELAEVLDSQLRSALHLASAKGHVEIANLLIKASPDMCLARDRDGRNPLHVATIRGNINVLEALARANHQAARVRVDHRDETVLHLCVKHNQLRCLEVLLETIKGQELVNARDSGGNTILHLAVLDKQFEIIKLVLKKSKIEVNAKNASGHTAMDILFAESGSKLEELDLKIEDRLQQAKGKRGKDLVIGDWLSKKKDALMVVASLIATMAFQAGVNPPGGVWQDNSDGHRAGEAVMAYNYPDSYPYFLRSNTIGFVASLSTILLLISGLSFKKKAYMWILVVIMWLTITSMAFTYAFSNIVVTPKKDRQSLSYTIVIAVIVWCSVMAILLLLHTVRLIASFVNEQRSRNKAIGRIFILEGQSWPTGWSLIRMVFGAGGVPRDPPASPQLSYRENNQDHVQMQLTSKASV